MKLFRMNLKNTFLATIIILFSSGLQGTGSAAEVKILPGVLSVDGNLFTVKGVNYSPVPICALPEIAPPDIHNRDHPLLREMGANMIRVWNYNHSAGHTDSLNKDYNNAVWPIYVVHFLSERVLRKHSYKTDNAFAVLAIIIMENELFYKRLKAPLF